MDRATSSLEINVRIVDGKGNLEMPQTTTGSAPVRLNYYAP